MRPSLAQEAWKTELLFLFLPTPTHKYDSLGFNLDLDSSVAGSDYYKNAGSSQVVHSSWCSSQQQCPQLHPANTWASEINVLVVCYFWSIQEALLSCQFCVRKTKKKEKIWCGPVCARRAQAPRCTVSPDFSQPLQLCDVKSGADVRGGNADAFGA